MTMERKTIDSALAGATLTGHDAGNIDYQPIAVMPDVRVVKIGGQSVLDRGRAALFPILDEIVEARKLGIQVVLLAGGGTRARHIYSIASELEVPTGVVATLGKYIPMQNARMLQMLLAKHGGLYILPDDFEKLPLYIQLGCIPVMSGMPPFGYWEKREEGSRIPPHRTDAGVFLSAEFLGARRAIFIKDEAGLYTDDPKKNPAATSWRLRLASSSMNRIATVMPMARPASTRRRMARPISFIRRSMARISRTTMSCSDPSVAMCRPSRCRQRSTMRLRRVDSRLRMLPIATSTNTGASASWIVCAIMRASGPARPPRPGPPASRYRQGSTCPLPRSCAGCGA